MLLAGRLSGGKCVSLVCHDVLDGVGMLDMREYSMWRRMCRVVCMRLWDS